MPSLSSRQRIGTRRGGLSAGTTPRPTLPPPPQTAEGAGTGPGWRSTCRKAVFEKKMFSHILFEMICTHTGWPPALPRRGQAQLCGWGLRVQRVRDQHIGEEKSVRGNLCV